MLSVLFCPSQWRLYFLPLRRVLILGHTMKLYKLLFSEKNYYLDFTERISPLATTAPQN